MAAPARRFIRFSRDWRDVATTAAATALLAVFWWLAVSASLEKSHTSDELPHITAGYAFDRFGDFRMHPENGVLPQRIFGLPPLADHARFPMDETLWRNSIYWQLGWDFFYSLGNPLDWIVLAARSLNALFGVALGLLIFLIAHAWHGRAGGLLALAFYAFSPQFLAHSSLATSDMAATAMLTIAPWFFWRHLERRDLASGLLAGVTSGFALVAKFNGVLLAPIYAALVIVDACLRTDNGPTPSSHARRAAVNLALAAGQAAMAWITIWAFFNFRFSPGGPDAPEFVRFAGSWQTMFASLGWKRGIVETMLAWKLFPEAWLYGLTNVLEGEASRHSFFAGEHSVHGWWQFFPALFLLKTTLAMLGAGLLAWVTIAMGLSRATPAVRRAAWLRAAPLLASTLVVGGIALRSNLNIGDRHILAIYPLLFVSLGVLATRRWLLALAGILACMHVYASCAIRPHYLASFNVLAGGPANAYRLFVDSSLDWGQDLPALRQWLSAHRRAGEPLHLGYFGSAWPPHYGVRPDQFLPSVTYVVRPPLQPYAFRPGLYGVSATILAEVYSSYRGPWTRDAEQRYQELRGRFAGPLTSSLTPAEAADYEVYDRLRFARLCKFLQRSTPVGNAGYSIPVFRLSADDLRTALEGRVESLHRVRRP